MKGYRHRLRQPILFVLAATGLVGCGGVDFYSTPDLKGDKTGIPIYKTKPYLLVKRTGKKDEPISIDVVHLPDTKNPYYAKPKVGLWKSDTDLTFSNGVLTVFGSDTDPKITELIGALAGVPGALATAEKTRAEADKTREEARQVREQSSNLRESADKIINVADDLRSLNTMPGYSSLDRGSQKQLEGIAKELKGLGEKMKLPDAEPNRKALVDKLKAANKQLEAVRLSTPAPTGGLANVWLNINQSKGRLKSILDDLQVKAKTAPQPTLTLYEVVIGQDGYTYLREVPFELPKVQTEASPLTD